VGELPYSLVIEVIDDPDFFGFYSPELVGLTGCGRSVQECIDRAREGMREHLEVMRERGLPTPPTSLHPTITVRDDGAEAIEFDPDFLDAIAQAREDVRLGRVVSHEEVIRQLGLDEES
jgi:predicted RNase H-like HicB family nuclease